MFLLTLCVLVGIVVIFLAKLSYRRSKICKLLPSKDFSFFNILGDIKDVILYIHTDLLHIKLLDIFRNRFELFQKHQLFCVWCFFTPFVLLVKSDAVQEVLNGYKLKEKSWVYTFIKPLLGDGLITSPHSIWKPRRKILSRCFHPDILRGFLPVYNANAQKLVKVFQENGKEFIDINEPVQFCSLDIICETVMDVKMVTPGYGEKQYVKSVRRSVSLIMKRIYTIWQWPDFLYWHLPSGKTMKFDIKVVNEFTEKVIQEKIKAYYSSENKVSKGKRQSLLDVLVQNHLETNELSKEDVRNETTTFILAGYDTTAVTVSWALFLIGLYPEVQAKIHEEVDLVFGGDADREATENDLNQLPYLDCVLKESLRLYPSSPMTARQAEEDITISGYRIPKGSTVAILTYFLHRDKDIFPDPEKFDPDRFSPENSAKIPPFGYIPFSAGPRNCIGYKYAQMEVKVIVSAIMRNFTLLSMDDRSKILPEAHIALHPTSPIYIKFIPRN